MSFETLSGYRRAVAISASATDITSGPPDAILVVAAATFTMTLNGTSVTLTTVAANTILPVSPEKVTAIGAGTIVGLYRNR